MAGDFSNKTLQIPTLKFEPVILDDRRQRRSIDGRDSDYFRCGLCFSDRGKPALRGTIDCCNHTFCFVCIVRWVFLPSLQAPLHHNLWTVEEHRLCLQTPL
ncbi:Zinc finger, RING/FYVE/PHD-type [Corchorus capsularis]|uniref:Zinc finger, RING/FYVE/PHD-type n=1 Tax=Corchorus capsularis TaxID=210143 RepID=A0A1R3HC61_COCAP|nr:Zinc finger, RING/FYVE/PHD-type [Corchorus capsularis]